MDLPKGIYLLVSQKDQSVQVCFSLALKGEFKTDHQLSLYQKTKMTQQQDWSSVLSGRECPHVTLEILKSLDYPQVVAMRSALGIVDNESHDWEESV